VGTAYNSVFAQCKNQNAKSQIKFNVGGGFIRPDEDGFDKSNPYRITVKFTRTE
jgi:hypothetical protein